MMTEEEYQSLKKTVEQKKDFTLTISDFDRKYLHEELMTDEEINSLLTTLSKEIENMFQRNLFEGAEMIVGEDWESGDLGVSIKDDNGDTLRIDIFDNKKNKLKEPYLELTVNVQRGNGGGSFVIGYNGKTMHVKDINLDNHGGAFLCVFDIKNRDLEKVFRETAEEVKRRVEKQSKGGSNLFGLKSHKQIK